MVVITFVTAVTSNSEAPALSVAHCPTFAVGFSSETDMVRHVFDVLLNTDGRLPSTENLLTCAHLFGLMQDPSLTRGRKYLHDLLFDGSMLDLAPISKKNFTAVRQ